MAEDDNLIGLATPTVTEAATSEIPNSDLSEYTLTIGEASSLMHAQHCKFSSNRKVQRMCKDGVVDCFKLSTSRNGQPVAEWLVNETSLLTHIAKNETKLNAISSEPPTAFGNANHLPQKSGDAICSGSDQEYDEVSQKVVAMPSRVGSANFTDSEELSGDDMAMPDSVGDASVEMIGETRTLASMLIENAKLTAELEGTRNLIGEIRDDKEFLRDELREARAGRKDVTAIAQRMLETLESIAIGGKLIRPSSTGGENADQVTTAVSDIDVPKQPAGDNEASMTNPFQI